MNKNKRFFKGPIQKPKTIVGDAGTSFSNVPISTLCASIELLINNLRERGCPVYDFDNKDKTVQQIRFIGGKVYFLATREDLDNGEGKERST